MAGFKVAHWLCTRDTSCLFLRPVSELVPTNTAAAALGIVDLSFSVKLRRNQRFLLLCVVESSMENNKSSVSSFKAIGKYS